MGSSAVTGWGVFVTFQYLLCMFEPWIVSLVNRMLLYILKYLMHLGYVERKQDDKIVAFFTINLGIK